ncbi:hypothetical protein ABEB36_012303 [Hypothenemus hampei]|uniref:RING-type E3 ubiquitin transferase n=1 Tax=Hypothenemus hampei TaxID=57062 RepID=A0ABD1EAT0_HYPHA
MNGAVRKTTVHNRNGNITHKSDDIQASNSPETPNHFNYDTSNSSETDTNEKMCSICLEDFVTQKPHTSENNKFGILLNCHHCFCFTCINQWIEKIISSGQLNRSCPLCRQTIEFIFPSRVWFESNEEKQLYISQEKAKMGQINCPYFQKGNSHCPFGSKCLYLHALPGEIEWNTLSPTPVAAGLSESLNLDLISESLQPLDDPLSQSRSSPPSLDSDDRYENLARTLEEISITDEEAEAFFSC